MLGNVASVHISNMFDGLASAAICEHASLEVTSA